MVSTSSNAGGIHEALRCFDTSLFLTSLLGGILFGNGYPDFEKKARSDNPSVVEHVHPISGVKKERTPNGFLESSREDLESIDCLTLTHIP